jgi:AraC-like DNA-binding protein
MPTSAVQSFNDPNDYAASIRGAKAELTALGSGQFTGKIIRIDFDRLWMQRASENMPRILHSANSENRAIISFATQPGPGLIRSGVEMRSNRLARIGKDHSYFQRSADALSWAGMSLPVEVMCSVGAAIAGCDLAPPPQDLIVAPRASAIAKLQRLHAAAGDLAERAPEIIANAQAARGLEQALTHAMVDCISAQDFPDDSSARRRHEKIMRRFHTAISERAEEAMYIPDLCAIVGVPERTLRLCCYESLGMGPKRYLLLRRMNLAWQALRKADMAVTTVTDVAANFRFWNFGRFSVEYKVLYGESPSTTLRERAALN